MDMNTYEETRLEKDDSWAKFLKEGMEAGVLEWGGKVVGVELPRTVSLQVAQTDPGVKGNTKGSGGDKPATLETGHVVTVPLFIQVSAHPPPCSFPLQDTPTALLRDHKNIDRTL